MQQGPRAARPVVPSLSRLPRSVQILHSAAAAAVVLPRKPLHQLLLQPPSAAADQGAGGERASSAVGWGALDAVRGYFQVFQDPVCNQRLQIIILGQVCMGPCKSKFGCGMHLRASWPLHSVPPADALLHSHAHPRQLPANLRSGCARTQQHIGAACRTAACHTQPRKPRSSRLSIHAQIGAVQGLAQFLCQLTKGVSGVVGDLLGSQVRPAFLALQPLPGPEPCPRNPGRSASSSLGPS